MRSISHKELKPKMGRGVKERGKNIDFIFDNIKLLCKIYFMRFIVPTKYRGDFFKLGRTVGEFFKDHLEDKQRRIIINSKMDGGKSVIAFGIDAAFQPERYQKGLEKTRKVDDELTRRRWEAQSPPVVFQNFGVRGIGIRNFKANVQDYAESNQESRILVASNLMLSDQFNSRNGWFEESGVDVSIEIIQRSGYKFNKDLVIDTTHGGIIAAIACKGLPIIFAP